MRGQGVANSWKRQVSNSERILLFHVIRVRRRNPNRGTLNKDAPVVAEISELEWFDFVLLRFGIAHLALSHAVVPGAFNEYNGASTVYRDAPPVFSTRSCRDSTSVTTISRIIG